jgi:hypothetical protein
MGTASAPNPRNVAGVSPRGSQNWFRDPCALGRLLRITAAHHHTYFPPCHRRVSAVRAADR